MYSISPFVIAVARALHRDLEDPALPVLHYILGGSSTYMYLCCTKSHTTSDDFTSHIGGSKKG